jgi:two-component system CheB/CheR fusion protein
VKTNKKGTINGVKVKQGRVISTINLSVKPLAEKKGMQKLLMVIFTQDKSPAASQEEDLLVYDETIYHDKYVLDLEEELQELKEKLHSAYEKLDSSNENLQSFNEELISANEEMQSTNEEMQSVNEELHTINSDYQWKNKELVEINDDLNNYFRSNINGQLFINNDLQLMKFSPGTVKQINLQDSDIGRPLSNISTNFKFETIIDDIKQVIAKGTVITKEIQTNVGRWYQTMTMPYIQLSDQKRTGAIITFNDITELKKIQQELDSSNQLLGMAIDSAEMGTWTIDTKTLEFIPSPRYKEIFGFYQEEDMTYEAAIGQIIDEHQSKVADAVKAAMENGEKYDVEYCLRGFHDGKLRWVRAIGSLTDVQKGKPNYFTGTIIDITVHKQDEIRKNDFIAMVSHELRTPLTSLQGFVQLLANKAKKADDASSAGMLDKAHNQVKKMTTMINGFLNVSQLEAGKIYLTLQTFDISALIKESVEEFALISARHNILLHECPSLFVHADRDKIGQVIANIISNAIKYSPKGKNILVSCEKINEMLQVSVKDEGMGIKPEDQERLFDRYHRIESANTQAIAGFGLGLYLSTEIIQRHQGKVWVESELGKGSTFYFNLPLSSRNSM